MGRPPADHWVDRPEVYAPQGVQLTGTNGQPLHTPHTLCVNKAHKHNGPQGSRPLYGSRPTHPPHTPKCGARTSEQRSTHVSVVIAVGKRPVPFRTRKLSPPAPMVLRSGERGRVGHRRHPHEKEGLPAREHHPEQGSPSDASTHRFPCLSVERSPRRLRRESASLITDVRQAEARVDVLEIWTYPLGASWDGGLPPAPQHGTRASSTPAGTPCA